MKIKDLIKQLSEYDPELDVVVMTSPSFTLDGVPILKQIQQCQILLAQDIDAKSYQVPHLQTKQLIIRLLDEDWRKYAVEIPQPREKVHKTMMRFADRLPKEARRRFLLKAFEIFIFDATDDVLERLFIECGGKND
jgi:hypothetical protein